LPADPDALYDALQGVVKDAGGKWVSDAGKVNLVGVTDLADRCQVSPLRNGWNDTLFAAWVDSDGHRHVIDARASINPGHDADPAGCWHLLEGAYTFKLDKDALLPDGKVRGWHDEKGAAAPRPAEGPPASTEGDVGGRPMLRAFGQYDSRWNSPKGDTPLRGDPPVGASESWKRWQANACHPTCVSMIFRWIEDKWEGRFKVPFKDDSELPQDHYPRRLMEVFWPELGGGRIPINGKTVPHKELRTKAEKVLGMDEGSALILLPSGLEKRLATLRKALARGPLVIGIPQHYVVLQAIAGGDMLICDPGQVLRNKWRDEKGEQLPIAGTKDSCGRPGKDAWKGQDAQHEFDASMYVRVPIHKKIKREGYAGHPTIAPSYLVDLLHDDTTESYWWPEGA
jgi:hypothetical protein